MGHVFSICPGMIPVDVFAEFSNCGTISSKGTHYKQQKLWPNNLSFEHLIDEEIENSGDSVFVGNAFTNSSAFECLLEPSSDAEDHTFSRTFSRNFHTVRSFEMASMHRNCFENNNAQKLYRNRSDVLPLHLCIYFLSSLCNLLKYNLF